MPVMSGAAQRPSNFADAMLYATWARAAASLGDRASWEKARQGVEGRLSGLPEREQVRVRVALAESAVRRGERSAAEQLLDEAELGTAGAPLLSWQIDRVRARVEGRAAPAPEGLARGLGPTEVRGLAGWHSRT
jgi:hypothetical protein